MWRRSGHNATRPWCERIAAALTSMHEGWRARSKHSFWIGQGVFAALIDQALAQLCGVWMIGL